MGSRDDIGLRPQVEQNLTRRSTGLAILTALFGSPSASADNLLTTDSYVNGRYWQKLGLSERLAWISGVLDSGAEFSRYVAAAHATNGTDASVLMKTINERFSPGQATRMAITEKISLIYNNPVNLILPVIVTFGICCKQLKNGFGADREFEDELTRTLAEYQTALRKNGDMH